jgi:hypothetical protein
VDKLGEKKLKNGSLSNMSIYSIPDEHSMSKQDVHEIDGVKLLDKYLKTPRVNLLQESPPRQSKDQLSDDQIFSLKE